MKRGSLRSWRQALRSGQTGHIAEGNGTGNSETLHSSYACACVVLVRTMESVGLQFFKHQRAMVSEIGAWSEP